MDNAKHGIRVNCVCPSCDAAQCGDTWARGHVASPEEVADAILVVDGGTLLLLQLRL